MPTLRGCGGEPAPEPVFTRGEDADVVRAKPPLLPFVMMGAIPVAVMKELGVIVRAVLSEPDDAAVLATLVSVQGSSYRRPGARLLIRSDGRRLGSISGGCLEEDVVARAQH